MMTITIVIFCLLISVAQAIPTYDLIVVRADIPTEYVIASVYANYMSIPVVFISPDKISTDVERELLGYVGTNYNNMLIIGGESAISVEMENVFKNMGFNIKRLWDWNRYGTAARAAIDLWENSDGAVLVDGENYQNMIVAQRYALKNNLPILFIKGSKLPMETKTALERLEVKKIYLFEEDIIDDIKIEINKMAPEKIDFEIKKEESPNWEFFMLGGAVAIVLLSIYFWKRQTIPSGALTEDENKIIKIVKKGNVMQNQLPGITDFSKPKVSRLLQELENRGIITRKKMKKTYVLQARKKMG